MRKHTNTLRTNKFSAVLIAAMLLLAAAACRKENLPANNTGTTTSSETVSDEDAADAITEAMTGQKAGMTDQATEQTTMAKSSVVPCGGEKDTVLGGAGTYGPASYDYLYHAHLAVICTLGIPSKFTGTFSGNTSYSTTRMSSDDSCSGEFVVTGLAPTSDVYKLNLNYVRQGSQQSNVRKKASFTSTITITGTDIIVDKTTLLITTGTASVVMTGATSTGATFSKTATLTFTGSKTATLTFGSGASYPLSW
ncbi:MAG: hypothetical protein KF744_14705 [Taibaiella sp.]|nr:hypothetical protein [Taibaiella sp.]